MIRHLSRFLRGTEGATAVEYAVMLALVLLACFVAIIALGQQTGQCWQNNNGQLKSVNFGS